MYILKIKGVGRMPDFIQIRDEEFTLVAYFNAMQPEKGLFVLNGMKRSDLARLIKKIPYGKIKKIEDL